MVKKGCMYLLMAIIISSCSNITGEDVFLTYISSLEQSLDQEDWQHVKKQADELIEVYNDHKWKVQLLGDEGEYEGLVESMHRFIVAIDDEALIEAKLELSTIKTLIKDIYSM